MISDRTRLILNLLHYPQIGPSKVRKALLKAQFTQDLTEDFLFNQLSIDKKSSEYSQAVQYCDSILIKCEEHSIKCISPADKIYPRDLLLINDFPPMLYYKGNIDNINSNCAAVVGTRKPSNYGQESAFRIAKHLAEHNITVVSGLAIGVDSSAHKGCLEAKGKTIAILAHGLDFIHPKNNEGLAEDILYCNGTLISEHPPGTKAFRTEFVKRNRIQSGISKCSIIIESGLKGGSIRQAEFTHRQNRRLFVVLPEKINASNSDYDLSGSNYLIDKYEALPIYNKEELYQIYTLFQGN